MTVFKKTLITLGTLLTCLTANAGNFSINPGGFSIGLGYALTNEWYDSEDYGKSLANYHGACIQLGYEIVFGDVFSLLPQLQFIGGWGKVPPFSKEEEKYIKDHTGYKINPGHREYWTLDIPVFAKFQTEFNDELKGFIMAGPFIGVGLTALEKFDTVDPIGITSDYVVNYYGAHNRMYSRFNVGAGAALGIDIGERHRLSAGYNIGLLDTSKIKGEDNRFGYMTVVYSLLF